MTNRTEAVATTETGSDAFWKLNLIQRLQYRILRAACPPRGQGISKVGPRTPISLSAEFLSETWLTNAKRKLRLLIGDSWADYIRGKSVVDFGCGDGRESVCMLLAGADHVIGLDRNPRGFADAWRFAQDSGIADRCSFVTEIPAGTQVDVVLTLDAFEHFADPEGILRTFRRILKPDGMVLVGFGPPWYHPRGSHVSPFPWSHLVLSEAAILRWRSLYWKGDYRTFREAGVQHLSIAKFVRAIRNTGFSFARFKTVPIRPLRLLHCKLTQEFTTTSVSAILKA